MTVIVHAEPGRDDRLIWWAESPDLAGFSAAGDTLTELRIVAEHAVRELSADRIGASVACDIAWRFASKSSTDGDAVTVTAAIADSPPATSAGEVDSVLQRA